MYKIVNLETFWIPEEEKYNLLKKEIGDAQHVLGLMLADGFVHNNPGDIIEKISSEVDLHIIPGMAYDKASYKKITPFNFNLHTTYISYRDSITHQWNPESGKFLFLGGVPNRPNRIGLLNKFYQFNLLKQAEWTFFKPWTQEQEEWCQKHVSNYDQLLTLCRSVDDVYEMSKEYGTDPSLTTAQWTKNTAWIDPDVFNRTSLSVISEGVGSDDLTTRYLTEKTYRVFVQRHPFIFAGTPDMYDYIQELGFKTFSEYMKISDYGSIVDEDERLNAVVENTKYFLDTYRKNLHDINQDIEHNYKRFFELADQNNNSLDMLKTRFGISQRDIDTWFNQKGFGHLVRIYGN